MKKLFSITVQGINKTWAFTFEGDDEFLEDWRDDGLEVDEIIMESEAVFDTKSPTMIKDNGIRFSCDCGVEIFSPSVFPIGFYRCNGCGKIYQF